MIEHKKGTKERAILYGNETRDAACVPFSLGVMAWFLSAIS